MTSLENYFDAFVVKVFAKLSTKNLLQLQLSLLLFTLLPITESIFWYYGIQFQGHGDYKRLWSLHTQSTTQVVKMKLQLALCFVLAFVACHAYDKDGQPGCKTQEELDIGTFRDNWDPTSYWKCELLNEAASRMKCPSEMGYLDSVKECVEWESWTWEEPAEPISEVEDE